MSRKFPQPLALPMIRPLPRRHSKPSGFASCARPSSLRWTDCYIRNRSCSARSADRPDRFLFLLMCRRGAAVDPPIRQHQRVGYEDRRHPEEEQRHMTAVISDATMNGWWPGVIGFAAMLTAAGPSAARDPLTAQRERMVREQIEGRAMGLAARTRDKRPDGSLHRSAGPSVLFLPMRHK
jgi:hypothetical protein